MNSSFSFTIYNSSIQQAHIDIHRLYKTYFEIIPNVDVMNVKNIT